MAPALSPYGLTTKNCKHTHTHNNGERKQSNIYVHVQTLFLSMNPPGDKIPVTVKRCLCPPETLVPEISSLPSDRTLLPVSSHQSWKRGGGREGERERIDTKLYSSLSLVVCVYLACHHLLNGSTTALNPSVSEDRGGTSCSDRTRITLEVQHCDHNVRTECEKYPVEAKKRYTGGYGQGRISVANTECVHVSSGHLAAQLCYFLQRC